MQESRSWPSSRAFSPGVSATFVPSSPFDRWMARSDANILLRSTGIDSHCGLHRSAINPSRYHFRGTPPLSTILVQTTTRALTLPSASQTGATDHRSCIHSLAKSTSARGETARRRQRSTSSVRFRICHRPVVNKESTSTHFDRRQTTSRTTHSQHFRPTSPKSRRFLAQGYPTSAVLLPTFPKSTCTPTSTSRTARPLRPSLQSSPHVARASSSSALRAGRSSTSTVGARARTD